uniref:Transmembrane protein 14A-like n=1 Tax=Sinocyclocheilus anshuiensis TaxID=1608454 RepID=A0A671M7S3_9TELE
MAVDWWGFAYAAALALGGFMGYKRKGSVVSLIAGLFFGSVSAYGAFKITNDPHDYWTSLSKYKNKITNVHPLEIQHISASNLLFLDSSRRRCSDCCDGNEVQEIWEINACRNHGRTEPPHGFATFDLLRARGRTTLSQHLLDSCNVHFTASSPNCILCIPNKSVHFRVSALIL